MYDLAIIGGGINGCGIARDAAGRGYSVYLAEKGDLASGTSSGSTKLIHGGLRYLEHYEFRLVREALQERETLWAMAPHIVWPLRFVLPHTRGLRPAWLLRLGLFLYDHIGGRKRLPGTRVLNLGNDTAGEPLRPGYSTGFEYSDCWVDDARLVVLNALDAAERGARINTRTSVTKLERTGQHWRVTLRNERSGEVHQIEARMVINAAGPWVDRVLGQAAGRNSAANVRLVQGSHIVARKLFDHDRCYIFQNPDGRIFFAIPYEQDFTLIGTTDREYDGELDHVEISQSEIDYLVQAANGYFKAQLTPADVVWTYSAVRPLFDDGTGKAQEASRDYVLKLDRPENGPKLLNVFGGKITTYRRLAEAALDMINEQFGRKVSSWTAGSSLPGGDIDLDAAAHYAAELTRQHAFLDTKTAARFARSYGSRANRFLETATSWEDLGQDFGAGLTASEVEYLRQFEWAETAGDILWRRSKLGLQLKPAQGEALAAWLDQNPARGTPTAA